MKRKMTLLGVNLLLIILPFLISCEKVDVNPNQDCGVPRESCRDCEWNVFKCKINGEEWCANCEGENIIFGCDPVDCQFYPNDSIRWLNIGANVNNYTVFVTSEITELNKEISLIKDNRVLNKDESGNCIRYFAKPENNFVKVTDINTSLQIIEGTFQFECLNECNDTLRISEGVFKLTYRP
ncbi:MAG: hypothetical protein R2879_10440 [Saprospiraceae bacterium]